MKKPAIIAVITALALALIAWYLYQRPKPAPKAAALLPDTTLLYAAIPDFPKSRRDWQQTQLCALWQQPDVQAFLAPLRNALAGSWLDPALEQHALGLLQGEVFAAVTRIAPTVGVVVGADVRGKQSEARVFLKRIEHEFARRFPGATATQKRYLGVDYEIWQSAAGGNVCHAFLDSLLVVTLDEDSLRDLIPHFTRQAPAPARTLSDSESFQNAARRAPAGHEAIVFLNFRGLLGLAGPLLALAPSSAGALRALATIESVAATVTFADGLIEDFALITFAGTNHVAAPPLERRTLALTSPDTSLYTAQAADLAALYRAAVDSVARSGNATLTAAAVRFDGELRRRGLRFDDDVLARIGPEQAWIGAWREGAQWPDIAWVAEVREANALRSKLDEAMDALLTNRSWETQIYLGESVRTLGGAASPVAPAYAVTEKFLIVASNADYARALVAQSKAGAATLVGNPDFTGALARVPARAASFTYCDVPRVLAALAARARANAASPALLDFDKLPKADTLTKHFAPYVSATVDTPAWETTTTFSTLGKPLTLVVVAAGAWAAAQPVLAEWPADFIPAWPRTFSGSRAGETPRGPHDNPPSENRTAPSQTPAP